LGKTSIIAIWLIALANAPRKVRRRLIYIVNRRTVVDQSTDEAKKIRDRLIGPDRPVVLEELAARLQKLAAIGTELAVPSTNVRAAWKRTRQRLARDPGIQRLSPSID
jgi:CRISPR-associated endonuclease/helicase Cas3